MKRWRSRSHSENTPVEDDFSPAEVDPDALYDAAIRLQALGDAESSLILIEQLEAILRTDAEQNPDSTREAERLASVLYSLGGEYKASGEHARAVRVLEEAEQIYRRNASPENAGVVADVLIRRATAQAARGFWASAPVDADVALATYRELAARDGEGGLGRRLDLARVLSLNAETLSRSGDPDLAVASAEQALRIYDELFSDARPADPEADAEAETHLHRRIEVALVAGALHAGYDRIERAIEVDSIAVAALEDLVAQGAGHYVRKLATTIAQRGVHLRRAGQSARAEADLRRADTLSRGAVELTEAHWRQLWDGPARITLADALGVAVVALGPELVPVSLVAELTGPAVAGRVAAPSERCRPAEAPALARRLALAAIPLLQDSATGEAGLRLGLEAHYLFAAASRAKVASLVEHYDRFGAAWAQVLNECSYALCDGDDDQIQCSFDTAAWSCTVAEDLLPFVPQDHAIGEIAWKCFAQFGRQLLVEGNSEACEEMLARSKAIRTASSAPHANS